MAGEAGWREYLPGARWYAAKSGGELGAVRALPWYTAAGQLPAVRSELAEVTSSDGTATYHLLVGYLPAGTAEPEALVTTTTLPGLGEVDVVDAPASKTAMQALLARLIDAPPPGMRWLHRPGRAPVEVRVSTAEQSNSTVFAEDLLVKVYRLVEPGPNPDPEVLAALDGRQVPALYGVLSGDGYDLAIVGQFLPEARDGWEYATAACAAGRGVDDELAALGQSLHTLHAALAEAFGTTELDSATVRRRFADGLADAIAARPELGARRDALAALLAVPDTGITGQRVHGDFHLGQAMLTGDGWRIIDFEGEPGASIERRRQFDSPWRDVAGLLRSIDYARSANAEPDGQQARAWAQRARAAFLAGYGVTDSGSAVLRAYEVHRMLYEVGYELRNRPDWVRIPLAAVEDMTRVD